MSKSFDEFALGARMFLPVAISVSAYGLVWGVLARQAGLSVLDVVLMSGIVFAGSAQFVALELWTPGAALPVGAIIMATLIVNLRYLLITASLQPIFQKVPPAKAAASMFLVTDENWALTMGQMAKGRGSPAFLLGGGVFAYTSWMASTVTGRLLGSAIDDPSRYGLDFAFTATFLALLLGMWRGKADLVPWIVAGATATIAAMVIPDKWYILIGGLVGSFVAAWLETAKVRRNA